MSLVFHISGSDYLLLHVNPNLQWSILADTQIGITSPQLNFQSFLFLNDSIQLINSELSILIQLGDSRMCGIGLSMSFKYL